MIAEVWQREQEAAHEARRLEEMKKEIAEERKLQELQMQAAEAGHIDKVERLEFMYKGGPAMMSAKEKSQEEEAYLLGEKTYQAPPEENEFAKAAAAPGALLADGPAARNETWNKLNADPLLMMRMQEQEARKHVTQNPVKMAQIQKEVAELREKKKAKKEAKKLAKKEKKEERKRAIKEEVRRKVLGEEGYAAAKLRETTEGRNKKQHKSGGQRRSADGGAEGRGRDDNSSSSGSPIRVGRPHSRSFSRSRSRSFSRSLILRFLLPSDARRACARAARSTEYVLRLGAYVRSTLPLAPPPATTNPPGKTRRPNPQPSRAPRQCRTRSTFTASVKRAASPPRVPVSRHPPLPVSVCGSTCPSACSRRRAARSC